MTKHFAILFLAMACVQAMAQDFPEKDDKGAVIYYKIFSAAEGYETLCIQDNTQKTGDYKYLLEEHDPQNKYQEWTLQPGSEEGTYLLRNRATFRYVSTSGVFVDEFYAITYSAKKDNSNQLLLTPLGNKQYAMTYNDGQTKRYMMVGDTDAGVDYFHRDNIYGTTRAWHIYPAAAVPTAVAGTGEQSIEVQVVKRKIRVLGTSNYEVFDIQGREMPADATLEPGIYVVQAGQTVRNVSVK